MKIDDLIIALIVLTGVRLIGFLLFLIIYLKKRRLQHLVLALGWLIYMSGPLLDLIINNPGTQSLHPVQGFTASAGTFLLLLSIVLYYRSLSKGLLFLFVSLFIIPLGMVFLFLPRFNGLITTLVQAGFLVAVLLLVILYRTGIQRTKSNLSFYWLCITLVFGAIHAFSFMLFFEDAPLSLRLSGTFLVNLSLLEFFIYLDWEHAFQRLKKSDERFRFLFKTAPTALFDADTSVIRDNISELKKKGVSDINQYYIDYPNDFTVLSDKLKIYNTNSQALKIFEASTTEELKTNIDILLGEQTYPDLLAAMLKTPFEQNRIVLETSIRTLTGKKRDILLNYNYSEKSIEEPRSMISMVDITEKNEIQKEIESSLHEKEILLQEVHHRVKNNLTIISSILGFQSHKSEDEQIKELIRGIENRINTMAIVHEQLYRSRNLRKVNFSDYIKELIEEIDSSYAEPEKSVSVIYDTEPVYLDINILIPAGMLINEIITNSYKHAFKNIENPEINVALHVSKQKGILSISDNGRGSDEKFFNLEVESTGLIIIKALVQQLKAEFELEQKNGTKYIFYIPLSSEE